MLINREKKHLHIHVPKTGGESLTRMLSRLNWNKKDDKILSLGAHATLGSFKKNIEYYKIVKNYYKTTMIRNPWQHAVSFYLHALHENNFLVENFFGEKKFQYMSKNDKLKINVSFENFIKKGYSSRCQSNFNKEFEDHGLKFDEWFDYANYEDMIKILEKKFNIKIENNIRTHDKRYLKYIIDIDFNTPYQKFYNEETYKIVKELSTKEINIFNYTF